MSAKGQGKGIGDYSASPTGQGCLWVVALGIVGVLGFSYLSAYAGVAHDPLDRVERGLAGVSKPAAHRSAGTIHAHRRPRRRHVAVRSE